MKWKNYLPILLIFLYAQQAFSKTPLEQVRQQLRVSSEILNNQPDSAFILAKKSLSTADELSFEREKAQANKIMGKIFFHQGTYQPALNYYLNALHYFQHSNNAELAEVYHEVGEVYYYLKQKDKALDFQQKALQLFQELKDLKGIALAFGSIGHLYEKKGQYNTALEYQRKALSIYDSLHYEPGKAQIFENMGSIYEDQSDFLEARSYFQQALSSNRLVENHYQVISNLNNIGDTYRKTGDYPSALKNYQESLDLARQLGDKNQMGSALRDMAKTMHTMGRVEEAYRYLLEGKEIIEEIYASESARQTAIMQTLYELEQKDAAIAILEQEKRISGIIKFSSIAFIVLLVLLASLIISRQRLKLGANRKLLSEREKVLKAENELIKADLANKELSEQQFQLELESRSKELTAHTLHNIQKNKILEELKEKLSELIDQEGKVTKHQLKKVTKTIEMSFREDKNWDDFHKVFEQVHQTFFDSLNKQHSGLTSSDLRLAAMIKLNMSSKDIATFMGISPDSLRISRYRLRKKLEIKKGENLSNYIQNL